MKFLINQVQQHSSQMPDAAGTGKFYVVVGVISLVFLGIVAYLISLDLKIKKVENEKI